LYLWEAGPNKGVLNFGRLKGLGDDAMDPWSTRAKLNFSRGNGASKDGSFFPSNVTY
jgi:hypothetical protein